MAQDGSPLVASLAGLEGSSFAYDLAPHRIFCGTVTRSSGIAQGYALVTLTAGELLPAGTAICQFRNSDGALLSEAGVGAVAPTTLARILADNVGTQTGVAVAAPAAAQPVPITFRHHTQAHRQCAAGSHSHNLALG